MPDKKLLLVDAYSLLYRAFFGGRYLTTSDNRPTGAVFGFAGMILSLLNNEKPDAIVVCWDAPHRTIRRQQFDHYKAHRSEPDPTLRAQMPIARQIVAAFGIPSAEEPGYEADDLIGTLATKGSQAGYRVVILTGDTDELQLVSDRVTVQMTQRGVSDVHVYDRDGVRQKYGIEPERIPDWKAIVGDTSDNIPGVKGIGAKGATELLQQWGTLEGILEHVEEVANAKHREALQRFGAQARDSKHLATIVCDVPGDFDIRPYAPTEEDWRRVRDLFTDLEFRSLLGRIPSTQPGGLAPLAAKEAMAPDERFATRVEVIGSAQRLQEVIAEVTSAGAVAIHIDTDSQQAMTASLRGVAFAASAEAGYYVAISQQADGSPTGNTLGGLFGADGDHSADASEQTERSAADPAGSAATGDAATAVAFQATVADVRLLLQGARTARIAYNAKFAEIVLERAFVAAAQHGQRGDQPSQRPTPSAQRLTPDAQDPTHNTAFTFDVLVAAYLLNAGRSSYPLMDLVEAHLGVRLEADDAFAPQETLAREAAAIAALAEPMRQRLAAVGMAAIMVDIEMPLIPVLARMEQTGVRVDMPYLGTLSTRMAGELEELAREIYTLAGEQFDIASVKQLQAILFDKLQLPTGKKTKTGYSTSADLLEQLAPRYEICRKILDWREVAKLKSTYADALVRLVNPRTGRIHTSLNQTRTSTGRLSSSDPNLQNIPVRSEVGREIRRTFVAPPGKVLLSCDYSQIELRILAHVTGDPTLVSAFTADEDIHAATAATVFGVPLEQVSADQRRQAKTINFAVIYGQSGFATAGMLGVETSVANQWIQDYFARLPGVRRYIDETSALAHKQRWVSTLLGRRRYLPEIDSANNQIRTAAERAAVNMPIQGTAADIMKLAMIEVDRYLRGECKGCTLLLQVHDELLFEVEEDVVEAIVPEVRRRMESAYPLKVRLRVDAKAGQNWAEMMPVGDKS